MTTDVVISLFGAVAAVISYILMTVTSMSRRTLTPFGWGLYHGFNLVGAVLIAVSMLIGPMNIGSFILQIVFGVVAILGIGAKLIELE